MSTNPTHGSFEDILTLAGPPLGNICRALRSLILLLDPEAVEIVWPRQGIASFGVGPKKMTEHYAYIGVQGGHMNLGFYHGASLPDPAHLLEGTGKKLRHIKIRAVAEVQQPAVAALLKKAIADRQATKA